MRLNRWFDEVYIIIILFLWATERKEERGHTSDFKKITAKFRDRFKGKKKKNQEIQGKLLSAR